MGTTRKPLLSRSGRSEPRGKCTEELKTQVPEQVLSDFSAVSEMPTNSEELRAVVIKHLYGQVPDDIKHIVWGRAKDETEDPFLRKLLYRAIYGCVHESIVERLSHATQGEKGASDFEPAN